MSNERRVGVEGDVGGEGGCGWGPGAGVVDGRRETMRGRGGREGFSFEEVVAGEGAG